MFWVDLPGLESEFQSAHDCSFQSRVYSPARIVIRQIFVVEYVAGIYDKHPWPIVVTEHGIE